MPQLPHLMGSLLPSTQDTTYQDDEELQRLSLKRKYPEDLSTHVRNLIQEVKTRPKDEMIDSHGPIELTTTYRSSEVSNGDIETHSVSEERPPPLIEASQDLSVYRTEYPLVTSEEFQFSDKEIAVVDATPGPTDYSTDSLLSPANKVLLSGGTHPTLITSLPTSAWLRQIYANRESVIRTSAGRTSTLVTEEYVTDPNITYTEPSVNRIPSPSGQALELTYDADKALYVSPNLLLKPADSSNLPLPSMKPANHPSLIDPGRYSEHTRTVERSESPHAQYAIQTETNS